MPRIGWAPLGTALLEGVSRALRVEGLAVLTPRQVPANDGGIALGQAVIAAAFRSEWTGPFQSRRAESSRSVSATGRDDVSSGKI